MEKVINGITYESNPSQATCRGCVGYNDGDYGDLCESLAEPNCCWQYVFISKGIKAAPKETPSEGVKYDNDKLQYSLLPPFAIAEMAKCLTFGAKKYAPENWKKVGNAKKRYLDASMRHIELLRQGEAYDKESGTHHLACAMTNLAFYLEFDLNPELNT